MTIPPALPIDAPDAPIPHAYVHMPFCVRKCPYCDFNSHAGRDAELDGYLEALALEIAAWAPFTKPKTIFVGGGTPTHGQAHQIERLMEVLQPLRAEGLAEFTIEANPGSLDRAKVRALREGGVDRTSLGVQTFHDRHLETLGRAHDASDAVRGIEILRSGDMPRFSLDLILAVPGQSLADLQRDIERAVDLAPEHVSAYVLTFEEGTAFTRMMEAGRLPRPEAERELAFLHTATERLVAAGYTRYEVSNFAQEGATCEHNLAYWRMRDWVGIGAGAHGHIGGVRWKNVDDPAAYAEAVLAGRAPVEWVERSTPAQVAFEAVMMGLRLAEGIAPDEIAARTGVHPFADCEKAVEQHVALGLLQRNDRRLAVVGDGWDLLAAMLREYAPVASDATPA